MAQPVPTQAQATLNRAWLSEQTNMGMNDQTINSMRKFSMLGMVSAMMKIGRAQTTDLELERLVPLLSLCIGTYACIKSLTGVFERIFGLAYGFVLVRNMWDKDWPRIYARYKFYQIPMATGGAMGNEAARPTCYEVVKAARKRTFRTAIVIANDVIELARYYSTEKSGNDDGWCMAGMEAMKNALDLSLMLNLEQNQIILTHQLLVRVIESAAPAPLLHMTTWIDTEDVRNPGSSSYANPHHNKETIMRLRALTAMTNSAWKLNDPVNGAAYFLDVLDMAYAQFHRMGGVLSRASDPVITRNNYLEANPGIPRDVMDAENGTYDPTRIIVSINGGASYHTLAGVIIVESNVARILPSLAVSLGMQTGVIDCSNVIEQCDLTRADFKATAYSGVPVFKTFAATDLDQDGAVTGLTAIAWMRLTRHPCQYILREKHLYLVDNIADLYTGETEVNCPLLTNTIIGTIGLLGVPLEPPITEVGRVHCGRSLYCEMTMTDIHNNVRVSLHIAEMYRSILSLPALVDDQLYRRTVSRLMAPAFNAESTPAALLLTLGNMMCVQSVHYAMPSQSDFITWVQHGQPSSLFYPNGATLLAYNELVPQFRMQALSYKDYHSCAQLEVNRHEKTPFFTHMTVAPPVTPAQLRTLHQLRAAARRTAAQTRVKQAAADAVTQLLQVEIRPTVLVGNINACMIEPETTLHVAGARALNVGLIPEPAKMEPLLQRFSNWIQPYESGYSVAILYAIANYASATALLEAVNVGKRANPIAFPDMLYDTLNMLCDPPIQGPTGQPVTTRSKLSQANWQRRIEGDQVRDAPRVLHAVFEAALRRYTGSGELYMPFWSNLMVFEAFAAYSRNKTLTDTYAGINAMADAAYTRTLKLCTINDNTAVFPADLSRVYSMVLPTVCPQQSCYTNTLRRDTILDNTIYWRNARYEDSPWDSMTLNAGARTSTLIADVGSDQTYIDLRPTDERRVRNGRWFEMVLLTALAAGRVVPCQYVGGFDLSLRRDASPTFVRSITHALTNVGGSGPNDTVLLATGGAAGLPFPVLPRQATLRLGLAVTSRGADEYDIGHAPVVLALWLGWTTSLTQYVSVGVIRTPAPVACSATARTQYDAYLPCGVLTAGFEDELNYFLPLEISPSFSCVALARAIRCQNMYGYLHAIYPVQGAAGAAAGAPRITALPFVRESDCLEGETVNCVGHPDPMYWWPTVSTEMLAFGARAARIAGIVDQVDNLYCKKICALFVMNAFLTPKMFLAESAWRDGALHFGLGAIMYREGNFKTAAVVVAAPNGTHCIISNQVQRTLADPLELKWQLTSITHMIDAMATPPSVVLRMAAYGGCVTSVGNAEMTMMVLSSRSSNLSIHGMADIFKYHKLWDVVSNTSLKNVSADSYADTTEDSLDMARVPTNPVPLLVSASLDAQTFLRTPNLTGRTTWYYQPSEVNMKSRDIGSPDPGYGVNDNVASTNLWSSEGGFNQLMYGSLTNSLRYCRKPVNMAAFTPLRIAHAIAATTISAIEATETAARLTRDSLKHERESGTNEVMPERQTEVVTASVLDYGHGPFSLEDFATGPIVAQSVRASGVPSYANAGDYSNFIAVTDTIRYDVKAAQWMVFPQSGIFSINGPCSMYASRPSGYYNVSDPTRVNHGA